MRTLAIVIGAAIWWFIGTSLVLGGMWNCYEYEWKNLKQPRSEIYLALVWGLFWPVTVPLISLISGHFPRLRLSLHKR